MLFLSRFNIVWLRRPLLSRDKARRLQDQALLRLLFFPGEKGSSCGVFKYFADTLVGLRRALKVLLGTDLLAHILGLGLLAVALHKAWRERH